MKKLYFTGGVYPDTAQKLVDDVRLAAEHNGKVELTISSTGGNFVAGMHAINELREMVAGGFNLITRVTSSAQSMGAALFQVGQVRRIHEDGTLLFHQIGMPIDRKLLLRDAEELVKDLMRSTGRIARAYTSHPNCKMGAREMYERIADGRDWEIHADQALELGFVDEIFGGAAARLEVAA